MQDRKRFVVVDDLGAKYRRISNAAEMLRSDLIAKHGSEADVVVETTRVESIDDLLAFDLAELRSVDAFFVDFELNTNTYNTSDVKQIDLVTPPVSVIERELRGKDDSELKPDQRNFLAQIDTSRKTVAVPATTGVGVLLYLMQALGLADGDPTNRVFAYVDLGQPTGRLFAAAAKAWFGVPTFPFRKDEQALSTRTIAERLKSLKGDGYQQLIVNEASRRFDDLLRLLPAQGADFSWLARPQGLDPYEWFRALLVAQCAAATAPYKRLGLISGPTWSKSPNTTYFHDQLVALLYDGIASIAQTFTGDDPGGFTGGDDQWPPSLPYLKADPARSAGEYDRERPRVRLHKELIATRTFWEAKDVESALNYWHRAALATLPLLASGNDKSADVEDQTRSWRGRLYRSYNPR